MGSVVLLVASLCLTFLTSVNGQRKLFCYYSTDAQYRKGVGQFFPENIDPNVCTHIIYAFFQPTEDGRNVRSIEWNDEGPNGMYARTVALKQKNPALKVLLAIGGWVIGSEPFLPIIRTDDNIATFSRNVVAYLRKHGMDGMDMDWEFPGVRGSTETDKTRFTLLMKTLQDEFTKEAAQTGKEKLLLTLATAAGSYYIESGYEAYQLVKYPDYMLLMTYNYHGSWENVTGHHSSVWPHSLDQGSRRELCMQWTVDFWLSKGAKREQIILGLATYGMTFTLVDPNNNGVMAPAIRGGGRGLKYTNERGIMAYYEVCEYLTQGGWRTVWIDEQKSPYAYGGDQWVGYDNQESLKIKVETMINGYNLAGAFVWSVEMDDFSNHCGQGRYPLLNTIKSTMKGGIVAPVVSPAPTAPRPSLPPTAAPTANPAVPGQRTTPAPFGTTRNPFWGAPGVAPVVSRENPGAASKANNCAALGRGIFPDQANCGQFFYCVEALEGQWLQYTMQCPRSLRFDPQFMTCVYDSRCQH